MKYIISEQQNNRLKEIIFSFLNDYLTPFGGWKKKEFYKKEIQNPFNDYELFIPIENSAEEEIDYFEDWDTTEHMFYSTCQNENYSYKIGECPEIVIPKTKYETLGDTFGEGWKPIFIEWFIQNTSLPVKVVRSQD